MGGPGSLPREIMRFGPIRFARKVAHHIRNHRGFSPKSYRHGPRQHLPHAPRSSPQVGNNITIDAIILLKVWQSSRFLHSAVSCWYEHSGRQRGCPSTFFSKILCPEKCLPYARVNVFNTMILWLLWRNSRETNIIFGPKRVALLAKLV